MTHHFKSFETGASPPLYITYSKNCNKICHYLWFKNYL